MSSVKIEVRGYIRTEPEKRFTPDGKSLLEFSVPHDPYKGETEWYKCTVWGEKRVEALAWLKKDMGVFVRGEFSIAEKDGKLYRNVTVNELEIYGGKKEDVAL